ncbi:MAG: NUDIX hydrolase [Chloroflexi bacterium]|nr:NUDIX hydrolase [Chloroflexota bacterium]
MTQSHDAPEVLSSERVHDRWLGLRVDRLRYPSGLETTHDVVEHRGGVTLLPIDADGSVLFVSQYRHAIGRDLLELPAGTLDEGEEPEVCAQRELQEEVGYASQNLRALGGFWSTPGFCTEFMYAYLARDLVPSSLEADDDENIQVVRIPLSRIPKLIRLGEIQDAKTIAALLMVTCLFDN